MLPVFRSYYRNQLKSQLVKDEVYCVQFYVSIGNNATFGIDAIEAHFTSGIGLDTINYGHLPLTYLIPQVRNPKGNIITDTLNWTLVTGTFKANGAEKYMVIGNFESDANTDTILSNPTNLPQIFCEISLDDVSCIPIDLPAYAGPDRRFLPGESIYLGRERDVGIDEACIWYKWPNMTTPIDTAAGIWVSPAQTSTYIVRQEICGTIKFDTVVVYQDYVGLGKLKIIIEKLKISPNPTGDVVALSLSDGLLSNYFQHVRILDLQMRVIKEIVITDAETMLAINTRDLANGIYLLRLEGEDQEFVVTKKLSVQR